MSVTCLYMSSWKKRGVRCRGGVTVPFMKGPGPPLSVFSLLGTLSSARLYGGEQLMDGGELQEDGSSPKFPMWIIEHLWAHKMLDIQEVVDLSCWPDVDSQPLSLEDSWRLRVVSAQVYSIVRSRDTRNYERAMGFLDATYRLLPRLVRAIKHMKIVFGLKTMVIMWMLKEGEGLVDVVSKIGQFFPNKLPQYQDQCSQQEMFLMRKNHADFKSFAQTLALNKNRLKDYIQNEMEEQYGEHYAQKVEDRLLHYLQELESALPGDTYIDKILKKHSPVTEEEKLLLEVITSDSTTIATTLRKLLHCDVATCRPAGSFQSTFSEKKEAKVSLHGSLTRSGEGKSVLDIQSEVFRGGREVGRGLSKQSPLLFEDELCSDVRDDQHPEEDDEAVRTVEEGRKNKAEEEFSQRGRRCGAEVSFPPQFCSKHQKWVKNILRGCPDSSSEELLHQTVPSSPVLFQSSSSTSSSQDLTPSNLVPPPIDQPPSQPADATNTGDKRSSGSPETTSHHSQSTSTKNSPLPAMMSPVVRLVDIASFWRSLQRASSNHVTVCVTKPSSSSSSSSTPLASSLCCASGNKDSVFVSPETHPNVQTASVNQEAPARTRRQPPTRQTLSKLSRKFRRACAPSRHSQALPNKSAAEQFVKDPAACPLLSSDLRVPKQNTSTSQSESMSSVCTDKQNLSPAESPQQAVHQKSDRPHPETPNSSAFHTKSTSWFPGLSSNLSRPYVRLTRLSAQECRRATERRASTGREEAVEQSSEDDEQRENTDSSFDVNTLYTSGSSSSNWEESSDPDPDYRPNIKKKRLLLEYESARVLHLT